MNHFLPSRGRCIWGFAAGSSLLLVPIVHAQTPPSLYIFGNPTAEEQLYIEYINRARANPTAEGMRLANSTDPAVINALAQFNVNKVMLQAEFAAIPIAPPLAPSQALTVAARGHSQYMLDNAVQTHQQPNPVMEWPQDRAEAAGYVGGVGENVYAFSHTEFYGHAGLQVDWDNSVGATGGMLAGRGHRALIHKIDSKEIGAGVVFGSNGSVGPQLVTQDIGRQSTVRTFVTGVAYYDLNSNDFYDIGEGIPGLRVDVTNASFYCETAAGGGWVNRVATSPSTRTATFTKSGTNFSETRAVVLPGVDNVKVDLKLAYTPPAITSAATASAGQSHPFTYTPVGTATDHKWNRWTPVAAPAENCNDLNEVTVSTSSPYDVRNTTVKSEGAASFHLVNGSKSGTQTVELNATYFGNGSPSFSFQSRLRWVYPSVVHKVQVRELGSLEWKDYYSQSHPTNSTTETAFSLKTIQLPQMANKAFKIRFLASSPPGSTSWISTAADYGWFVDQIAFTNISKLTNLQSETLTSASGSFVPAVGTYVMSVNPVIGTVEFPAGYQTLSVTEPPPPPPVQTFSAWAALLELSLLLSPGSIANHPQGDYDNDGRTNLVEFAFGALPHVPNDPAPRLPKAITAPTHFILRYERDLSLSNLALTPRASSDFVTWKAPGEVGAPTGFVDELISTVGTIQTREAKIPFTAGSSWFMQVEVIDP